MSIINITLMIICLIFCSCSFFAAHPEIVVEAEEMAVDIGETIVKDVEKDIKGEASGKAGK